jgi:hypothetical protein
LPLQRWPLGSPRQLTVGRGCSRMVPDWSTRKSPIEWFSRPIILLGKQTGGPALRRRRSSSVVRRRTPPSNRMTGSQPTRRASARFTKTVMRAAFTALANVRWKTTPVWHHQYTDNSPALTSLAAYGYYYDFLTRGELGNGMHFTACGRHSAMARRIFSEIEQRGQSVGTARAAAMTSQRIPDRAGGDRPAVGSTVLSVADADGKLSLAPSLLFASRRGDRVGVAGRGVEVERDRDRLQRVRKVPTSRFSSRSRSRALPIPDTNTFALVIASIAHPSPTSTAIANPPASRTA